MRRAQRCDLSSAVKGYLGRMQLKVGTGGGVQEIWDRARRTKTVGTHLLNVLLEMAGKRERCMFCNDSRGTDIEHFWPKAPYPEKSFIWTNMLLACTGCNRKKGDRFPLDADGRPLLIDPSVDDPWEFLDYIPATGEVAPRWRVELDGFDPKGEATTDTRILPLNIEAVTTGRQRCYRSLCKAVTRFLDESRQDDDFLTESAFARFAQDIHDLSDFGLSRWLFHFCNPSVEPLCRLSRDYSAHWKKIREMTSVGERTISD